MLTSLVFLQSVTFFQNLEISSMLAHISLASRHGRKEAHLLPTTMHRLRSSIFSLTSYRLQKTGILRLWNSTQPNITVKAAPFGRWTLRDKAPRSAPYLQR